MQKPEDIPEDVWEAAAIYVGTAANPDLTRQWIARAILAERERCAKLCDKEVREARAHKLLMQAQGAHWCASAIRKGASHDHE